MVKIKICGLRSPEHARAAASAGVDAIGLVFHPASSRCVDTETAREICRVLPPFVTTVGLFVDASAAVIESVLERVPLQMLQFHGDESETDCERWGRPYLKALRMRPGLDVTAALEAHPSAAGILVDSYQPGVPGGTGHTFDWARLPRPSKRALVLAGGLNAQNVGEAISRVRPWAVDVSGGVESRPGIKDSVAIDRFVRAVRASNLES